MRWKSLYTQALIPYYFLTRLDRVLPEPRRCDLRPENGSLGDLRPKYASWVGRHSPPGRDRVNASSTGCADPHGLPAAPFSRRRNLLACDVD
jgi:hypothetical protein